MVNVGEAAKTRQTALIFGATGYTGRAVVRRWAARGLSVAHIRPGSPAGTACQREFEALGAQVQRLEWEPESLRAGIAAVRPDVVFCLLGTTRARAKRELPPDQVSNPYRAVDERLTIMAAEAVKHAAPDALVVYLSALGVSPTTRNAYLQARYHVEQALLRLELRHVVVRPGLISGADRKEFRLAERAAALGLNGLLGIGALSGARPLRELKQKYASLTGDELAAALVAIAADGTRTGEILVSELRRYAELERKSTKA